MRTNLDERQAKRRGAEPPMDVRCPNCGAILVTLPGNVRIVRSGGDPREVTCTCGCVTKFRVQDEASG